MSEGMVPERKGSCVVRSVRHGLMWPRLHEAGRVRLVEEASDPLGLQSLIQVRSVSGKTR